MPSNTNTLISCTTLHETNRILHLLTILSKGLWYRLLWRTKNHQLPCKILSPFNRHIKLIQRTYAMFYPKNPKRLRLVIKSSERIKYMFIDSNMISSIFLYLFHISTFHFYPKGPLEFPTTYIWERHWWKASHSPVGSRSNWNWVEKLLTCGSQQHLSSNYVNQYIS